MSDFALASHDATLDTSRFPAQAGWVVATLNRLNSGRLDVTFPDGQRARFGDLAEGRGADIRLRNWNVIGAALKSGDIGFAETYIAGDWTSSDLAQVLVFFIRNRDAAEAVIYGSFWGRLAYRIKHLLNRNTKTRARKNIHAHYDIGNSFYTLWLDSSMTYSSALFGASANEAHAVASALDLERAQQAKYQRVVDELALKPQSRVLEIGCGWGGFAATAAEAGHHVTGLTLSTEQLAYANQGAEKSGHLADLKLQDYRDESGRYDAIASIEMFEAVGEAYWPAYFDTLKRCLAMEGRACIQTITIADELFDRYRNSTDFIQQYIFPGGMLPSPSEFRRQAERAGLKVINQHAFGLDYARTLATWRSRFMAQLAEVRRAGFDDRFIRIWEFYLAYCEAAFARKNTDVVQYTLVHA